MVEQYRVFAKHLERLFFIGVCYHRPPRVQCFPWINSSQFSKSSTTPSSKVRDFETWTVQNEFRHHSLLSVRSRCYFTEMIYVCWWSFRSFERNHLFCILPLKSESWTISKSWTVPQEVERPIKIPKTETSSQRGSERECLTNLKRREQFP